MQKKPLDLLEMDNHPNSVIFFIDCKIYYFGRYLVEMERRVEKYGNQYETRMNVEMRKGFVSMNRPAPIMNRKGIFHLISSTPSHSGHCVCYLVGIFIII